MRQGMKTHRKTILAWVLAIAMTFANVEPVSAAVISMEDVTATKVGTQTGEDVTNGDVIDEDVTDGDVTDGDVTGGDVSEGDPNIIDSGVWHGIIWEFTRDGVLVISGEDTNEVAEDLYHWEHPWYNYHDSVVEAVVSAKNVKSTQNWFRDCKNLKKVDFSEFDTSKVTDMSHMFYFCLGLEQLDLNEWNVSNVTDMCGMFSYCSSLKQLNISKWDVRKVTDMRSLFYNCDGLTKLDLSKWNMNSVTTMSSMFQDSDNLAEVKLGKANSGTLQNLSSVFQSCENLKKISFGKINTGNVTNMASMFYYCLSLENLNLSGFDTGNVTTMEEMFEWCEQLKTLNIKGFDTGKVTNMAGMFRYCKSLSSLDVSGFDTGNVTTMRGMFAGCENLTSLDVSGFDTGKVTNMESMFYDCFKVKELDLSGFDTSNVTDMNYMCNGCNSLTELDFSGFDISKAERMAAMCSNCENLGRVKVYVNLQKEISLPSRRMYDLNGKEYKDYYPIGLTESIWLYSDSPTSDGNMWVKDIAPQVYTGKAIKPQIQVYDGNTLLTEKVDYTISYKNNTKANDASNAKSAPSVVVKGKGNYSKQDIATFQILPRDLTDETISAYAIGKKANGKVQKPIPVVTYQGKKLSNKKDFTVSYPDLEDENIVDAYKAPGTYRILVTGKGNFGGEREILFTITEGTLMSKVKIAAIPNQEYTGEEICPEVTVTCGKETLVKDTDYTLSYENNVEVGKATVVVTGKGDKYAGTKTAAFKITGISIAKAEVSGVTDLSYSGSPLTQEFTIGFEGQDPLIEGQDYTVKYTNNVKPGKATMTITGMGLYTGTVKKSFRVKKLDIQECGVGYSILNPAMRPEGYYGTCVSYTKGSTKLKFAYLEVNGIELVEGKDYTISYLNNINKITFLDEAQKPIARVKGKGNYTGTMDFVYVILPSDISRAVSKVSITVPDVMYSAKPGKFMSKPIVKDMNGKKLTAGVDYEKEIAYYLEDGTPLSKDSVVEAGQTVTAVIVGKGNYTGTREVDYHIMQADIKKAKFKITPQVYTGYPIWPSEYAFEVAKYGNQDLVYGEDYIIVDNKNNLYKGTATVTIQGLGNYGGTKTVKFKIVSREMIWFWKIFD